MAEPGRRGPVAPTPAQTVGPFLHLALADPAWRRPELPAGATALTVRGRVLDGAGAPLPDAVVETWQHGGPLTRCTTDDDGHWEVRTRHPVAVATIDGTPQAPHLAVSVFARGLLDRVVTRLYLPDDPAHDGDPALAAAGDRAGTLIARPDGPGAVRFDIHLQGPDESVFFDV